MHDNLAFSRAHQAELKLRLFSFYGNGSSLNSGKSRTVLVPGDSANAIFARRSVSIEIELDGLRNLSLVRVTFEVAVAAFALVLGAEADYGLSNRGGGRLRCSQPQI
jgi:hypothetical protein